MCPPDGHRFIAAHRETKLYFVRFTLSRELTAAVRSSCYTRGQQTQSILQILARATILHELEQAAAGPAQRSSQLSRSLEVTVRRRLPVLFPLDFDRVNRRPSHSDSSFWYPVFARAPGATYAVTTGHDRSLIAWRVRSADGCLERLRLWEEAPGAPLFSLAVAADGRTLFAGAPRACQWSLERPCDFDSHTAAMSQPRPRSVPTVSGTGRDVPERCRSPGHESAGGQWNVGSAAQAKLRRTHGVGPLSCRDRKGSRKVRSPPFFRLPRAAAGKGKG